MRKKEKKYQNIESLISQGTEIKGKIIAQGSIRVDGIIDGEIDVKGDLIVGEKGMIKGEIKVENITLGGTIEGNVQARGRFEITSTGIMNGDVVSSIISIDEGAVLDGTSKMARPNHESGKKEFDLQKDKKALDNVF